MQASRKRVFDIFNTGPMDLSTKTLQIKRCHLAGRKAMSYNAEGSLLHGKRSYAANSPVPRFFKVGAGRISGCFLCKNRPFVWFCAIKGLTLQCVKCSGHVYDTHQTLHEHS